MNYNKKQAYMKPEVQIFEAMSEGVMVKPSKPEPGYIDDPLSKENGIAWEDNVDDNLWEDDDE